LTGQSTVNNAHRDPQSWRIARIVWQWISLAVSASRHVTNQRGAPGIGAPR